MPLDPSVVQVILEACDRLITRRREVRLSDVLAYVDARWRVIPSCEELAAALAQRPRLGIARRETGITLAWGASGHVLEPADLQSAYQEYQARFVAREDSSDEQLT